jgi:hypothetical protein
MAEIQFEYLVKLGNRTRTRNLQTFLLDDIKPDNPEVANLIAYKGRNIVFA